MLCIEAARGAEGLDHYREGLACCVACVNHNPWIKASAVNMLVCITVMFPVLKTLIINI